MLYEVLTGIQYGPADRLRVFKTYDECLAYIRHMNLHRFEAISLYLSMNAAMDQCDEDTWTDASDKFDAWMDRIKFGRDYLDLLSSFRPDGAVTDTKKGFVLGENMFINQIEVSEF